jgi:hypothetical protein
MQFVYLFTHVFVYMAQEMDCLVAEFRPVVTVIRPYTHGLIVFRQVLLLLQKNLKHKLSTSCRICLVWLRGWDEMVNLKVHPFTSGDLSPRSWVVPSYIFCVAVCYGCVPCKQLSSSAIPRNLSNWRGAETEPFCMYGYLARVANCQALQHKIFSVPFYALALRLKYSP